MTMKSNRTRCIDHVFVTIVIKDNVFCDSNFYDYIHEDNVFCNYDFSNDIHEGHQKYIFLAEARQLIKPLRGTLSVKFGIYVHQTIIFKEGY